MEKLLKNQEELDKLAGVMFEEFRQSEIDRRMKEIEWEENLRQVKGIYDPEILRNIQEDESKVYPRYTRSKEVPAIAKLNNILLPAFGENWDIEATPNPEIPKEYLDRISKKMQKKIIESNYEYQPTEDDIKEEIQKLVEKKKEGMKRTISDQLIEMNYRNVIKRVIKSGIRYGTGVWKGPLSTKHVNKRYTYEDGQITEKNEEKYIPDISYVPIWRFYPDMSTSEKSETSFIFQHHCLTLSEMYALMDMDGFDKKVLKEIMKENPQGDYKLKNWEQSLLNIDNAQQISKNNRKSTPSVKGFEMLERWGLVDGKYLIQAGVKGAEDLDEGVMYETAAWLINKRMVKIVISPLQDITVDARPFNIFYYDKDESSIFGEGLPRTIRGTAISIGAASRMILDNASIIAGPQVEVNMDLLDEDQDVTSLYSRKIWYREGRGVEAQYPAIRQLQFDSHIQEFQSIINMFKEFGDEESALPAFLFSEPEKTNTETATGMDIRSDNLNVTLNDIVKNFDEPNENFIRGMYKWNMEFNENEQIKGDYDIKSLGSSSIINKQTRSAMLTQFASTLTEEERLYLDTPSYLKERAKLMDLDGGKFLRSEKEVKKKMEEMRDPEAEKLEKALKTAEVEYTRAKAAHMFSKAKSETEEGKKKNIEFQKELNNDEQNT